MKSLNGISSWRAVGASGASLLAAGLLATSAAAARGYQEANLVSNDQAALAALGFAPAAFTDPNLVNPWDIARSPTGPWWVANQATATSSIYKGAGQPLAPVVSVQQGAVHPGGPTGELWGIEADSDGLAGSSNSLFFAAGVGDEAHGLFGSLTAVPEPQAWMLMIMGVGLLGAQIRALRRRQPAGD
jgi:hypothetical protein